MDASDRRGQGQGQVLTGAIFSSSTLAGTPADVPVPAATVVPLRDGPEGLEVALLRRGRRGAFPGYWVFPGGKIEEVDRLAARARSGDAPDDESAPARAAALREADEEAGLVLVDSDLVALSFWLPPPEAERRFATWFFLAPAPPGEVMVDRGEIREHRWVTPARALELRDRGEMRLAPPTWMTLRWLSQRQDTASALADARSSGVRRYSTKALRKSDGEWAVTLWEGDAAYVDGDLDRPGGRRRLILGDIWRFEGDD